MKKVIGYLLLALSVLAWVAIGFLPFLDISKAQVAAVTTVLLISGEVFFYCSLIFLGRDVIDRIKSFFKRRKSDDAE